MSLHESFTNYVDEAQDELSVHTIRNFYIFLAIH